MRLVPNDGLARGVDVLKVEMEGLKIVREENGPEVSSEKNMIEAAMGRPCHISGL